MKDIGIWLCIIGLLSLMPYIGYRMGREIGKEAERSALTSALSSQIEGIYMEGFQDGVKQCVR
jgi:uncharacterized membrane protein